MKQLFICTLLALLSYTASAQGGQFTIKGQMDHVQGPAKIILQYYGKNNVRLTDSTELVNGHFALSGEITKPMPAILYLVNKNAPVKRVSRNSAGEITGADGLALYLDVADITITGSSLKNAIVKGDASHDDYSELRRQLKPFFQREETLYARLEKLSADERKGAAYEQLADSLTANARQREIQENQFIREHANSYVAWNIVISRFIIERPKELQELYNAFGATFRNSSEGKLLATRMAAASNVDIGQAAPELTLNDSLGNPVSLASLRGKFVLIDFWASWCGPCRAENPNVKKAYDTFSNKNFEVYAISLDDKKDQWTKAIVEDGMPWVHVSDLAGTGSPIAKEFDVIAIPQNWLINPKGEIIAKNLRGEELQKKLRQFLN